MSEALYEQYKEALRRGHVAAMRGRLDIAEGAYRAAAAIAPHRALPYASLGGVFRRLGRLDEALAAYGAALARAPEDEGALRGRAELHAEAGRRSEAAADFEALCGVVERAGRLTDAYDAARRALELAESRSRRYEVERLGAVLRGDGDGGPSVVALDQALRTLEAVETPIPQPGDSPAGEPTSSAATPEAESPPDDFPPAPDPAVLRAVADALLDSGDIAGAGGRYLALAALHRSAGHHDAAMDACLALLAVAPSNHRLQLAIAELEADRGWLGPAREKLRLLARLAELDDDADARAAVAALGAKLGLEPARSSAAGA